MRYAQQAMKAAPGIRSRRDGDRGLTAQTSSAALPSAMSGDCQTQVMVTSSVSPNHSA